MIVCAKTGIRPPCYHDTTYPRYLVCSGVDPREEFPDVERFEYEFGTLKSKTCFDQDMIEIGPGDGQNR